MLWHVPHTPTRDPTDLSNWFWFLAQESADHEFYLLNPEKFEKNYDLPGIASFPPVLLRLLLVVVFCFKKTLQNSVLFWIIDIYGFPIDLVTVKIEASLDMEPAWILDALHGESVFMISWKVEVRKLMVKLIATPQTRFSPQKEANEGKSPFFQGNLGWWIMIIWPEWLFPNVYILIFWFPPRFTGQMRTYYSDWKTNPPPNKKVIMKHICYSM